MPAKDAPPAVEMVRASGDRGSISQPSKRTTGKGLVSNFSQQKLRAWQPVLTPKWIITVFIGFGIVFLVLGIILLIASNGVTECSVEYGDPDKACSNIIECTSLVEKEITINDCVGPHPDTISPPVYVYYELTNYYQNHRRYVKSRSDEQLRGNVITDASDLASCEPIITGPNGTIYSPCGLIAWSVFNDTFTFEKDQKEILLNDDPSVIAWSTDVEYKFRNPDPSEVDPSKVHEWINEDIFPGKVENGHFIVWMRNAALPNFRKLYAKIDQEIHLPVHVKVQNRYPVNSFGGKKSVILSTTSWLGGRNSFLGIAYLVIGTWCLIFGLFFVFKNYKTPRILGDVRYLNWVGNRRSA